MSFPRSLRKTQVAVAALSFGLLAAVGSQAAQTLPSQSPVSDREVIEAINTRLADAWREAGVVSSKQAPDLAWARRAYLDLLGRIPTVQELSEFQSIAPAKRREWLVDHLLGSQRRDERARWQATEWANLLIGRTGGTNRRSLAHRDSFMAFLTEAFEDNRPYDEITRRLITAKGSVRPEDEDHDPAASYLADKMAENGVQATAKTAQVFLGMSVQCTQCHNHPFNEGKQNQFWELNAFFRQTRAERIREEDGNRRYARIAERDFFGEGRGPASIARLAPGQPEQAETFYELRNGKLKVAYPVFVDGTALADVFDDRGLDHGDSGRLELVNRRVELADLVVDSPDFARAAVNREWARLFGYGIVSPVEDMGPHNPPTHPELLEELAEAFRQSGYDLQRLTRWIALSDAYALDSRARKSNQNDDPSLGEKPQFSRFYLRQLSAEQVYDSLLTATRADEVVADDRRDRARQNWLRQFNTAFGNDENGEATSFDGSIPQSLAMMNSQLMQRATTLAWSQPEKSEYQNKSGQKSEPVGFLSSVAYDDSLDNGEKVKRLYLAALARQPDRSELRTANGLLARRKGKAHEALRDIWWALLNSNEFILQH